MKKLSYLIIITLLVTGLAACVKSNSNSAAGKTEKTKLQKKTVDFNVVSYEFMKAVQQENKNLNLLCGNAEDINGDNVDEVIMIVGSKKDDYLTGIRLIVFNGETKNKITEHMIDFEGYNAQMFLKDFDEDKLSDILITIDSGGSSGFTWSDLLTFKDNKLTSLLEGKYENQMDFEFTDGGSVGFIFKELKKEYFVDLNAEQKKIFNSIKAEVGYDLKSTAYFRNNKMSGNDIDGDGVYELKNEMSLVFSENNNSDFIADVEQYFKYVSSHWKLIKIKVTPKNGTTQVKEMSLGSNTNNSSGAKASKISKEEALRIVRNIVGKDAELTVLSTNYKRNNREYYSISFVIDDMEADFRYCVDKIDGSVYMAAVDNSFKPYKK